MTDDAAQPKSWLERLSQSFLHEPQDKSELMHLLRDAAKRKLIDNEAWQMIQGVLSVSSMQASDIMIPRAQMVCVEINQTPQEFLPTIVQAAHSRFPVIGEDKDDVVGILLAKDLLKHFIEHPDKPLKLSAELLRPAVFVPESKRLDTLLKEFRASRNHLAIVVDEYGGIAGVVTMEDVLEEIVGEIEDEYDIEDDPNIRANEQGFIVKASTEVTAFNEHFKAHFDDEIADTMGGIILHELGYVPKVGETLTLADFTFTILSADDRHIHNLKVEVDKHA